MLFLIDDWMDYYNNDRYQWQLVKLSPNQFYEYTLTGIHPLLEKGMLHPQPPAIDSTPKNAVFEAPTATNSEAGSLSPAVGNQF